ncbi:PilZ domain-containing protein [Neobacillus niacini]|uniref:PilZ domain-containing protein n=1 Tax=Neobacillus niacini TaxID=86668 RepID=UPI002FFFCC3C
MEAYLILLIVAAGIIVSSILYLARLKELKKQKMLKKVEKQTNQRDNFRLRVMIKNSIMEVLKVGSTDVNQNDNCEIEDISAGGAGIISYYDFPLKQKVYVRIHFYLNDEEFSLDGRIVRKIERINRSSFFYGIQFLNLSSIDEKRLVKEIFAMENQRRKIAIK